MTNKQSNEEKIHTDRDLTEETNVSKEKAISKTKDSTKSPSIEEQNEVEEITELTFDEEAQANDDALAAAEELDQLDQGATDASVKPETSEQLIVDEEGVVPSESEKETREKRRQQKQGREKKPRLRLIPIWLRIVLSILLIGGSLILGLMFGYGVIGGGEPGDAIKPETWYHIVDIIRGN